ncbi:MAG: EAL domain-containing protein, partial [Gammaproteobacteria bacterium]
MFERDDAVAWLGSLPEGPGVTHRLLPEQGVLVVEVTEQSIIDDVPGAAAKLDDLRRHGIAIALDDFGTGYSSLSAL